MTIRTDVIALIPAYSHVDYRLQEALVQARIDWKPFHECSDLPKARSQLISWGLARPERRVFLLIDSDIVPTAEQIHQLLSSPKLTATGAVTGAYLTRDDSLSIELIPGEPLPEVGKPGFARVAKAGLGFCAIRREPLEALALPRVTLGGWRPFCLPYLRDTAAGLEYLADDFSLWGRLKQLDEFELWFDQELLVGHAQRRVRHPHSG